MCLSGIVAVVAIVLFIRFMVWQFKMLKKYALTFDGFKINAKEGYLVVNEQVINFADIDYVTVRETQQPSALEKTFSKSAFYAYMAEVVFRLQDGMQVSCRFNTKGALYKALKQLEPYVQINACIENYAPRFGWEIFLFFAAIILCVLLAKIF